MSMIETRALKMTRGGHAILQDIDFTAGAGEVTVLIGPNGAGKSSLVKVLAGDCRGYRGQVRLAGRCLRQWRSRPESLARLRAVMPQFHPLNFALTVEELVSLGRLPHRGHGSPASDRDMVARAMRLSDVESLAARPYTRLSGGQQARAQFGRVLAQINCGLHCSNSEPRILFLDEPTASLDIRHQVHLMQTARELAREGVCVIAVLHDLNLAARFADRIAILRHGRLCHVGTPAEVMSGEILGETFGLSMRTVLDSDSQRLLVSF